MSIDLKQLKYFLAVAEEKSFSRAAERLHISQPPLSQQIMKLESELGVRLFTRTTRTFELTVAGKALMGEAAELLGKTRVTWTLHEFGPSVQYEALRAKQIDVGFWREPKLDEDDLRNDNLRQELCFRENVCVAINEHHALAKLDAIELADIAHEPMLTLALDKSAFPRYLIQCCVKAGFHPVIFQEASEPQTLLAMVGAGLGVALLPETTSRIGWPGVVFLPIRSNPPSANLYITYTTLDDAPVVRAFLNILNPPARTD